VLSGTAASNYSLAQPTGLTADIYKAGLTVSAVNAEKIYGSDNPALTVALSGFVGGETLATVTGRGATASTNITLNATGVANTPSLRINTSSSASFVHTQENFAANLTAGQRAMIFFGKVGSTKNAGAVGYYWAGDASNSNFITLGHWGNDDLFRIYGDGTVTVGTNTVYHAGNLTNLNQLTNGPGYITSSTTSLTLTGNLTVSSGNTTGGGIILADDGDIVDLNDSYCSMRFSGGVRIFSANRGGSAVITLGNNGAITANGNITGANLSGTNTGDQTNISGYSTQLNGYGQQIVYTILDGPANGPVIKVRYDGATANRYIDIGSKDGNGVYYEGFKIYTLNISDVIE
jgi:hypothetical protein